MIDILMMNTVVLWDLIECLTQLIIKLQKKLVL